MHDTYRPRQVREPITGLEWLARSPAQAWLAWWPLALLLAVAALAFAAGRFTAWWWV